MGSAIRFRAALAGGALIGLVACAPTQPVADRDAQIPDGALADGAVGRPLLPTLMGSFWQIASSPDLGAYDNRPQQQPVDFAIWQAADGTWQLWSCIRSTKVGGNTRLFYRWEGAHLTDADWTPMGIAMMADPTLGEAPGGLQAPHVTRIGDVWHMFYGDWAHICHATSNDGKTFTRVIQSDGNTGMFAEGGAGAGTRDPMLFVAPSEVRLYYTNSTGVDFVRTSVDVGGPFGPSKVVARGGSAGISCCSAECPFVARPSPGGDYFLFRTQRYGVDAQTSVYRSPDLSTSASTATTSSSSTSPSPRPSWSSTAANGFSRPCAATSRESKSPSCNGRGVTVISYFMGPRTRSFRVPKPRRRARVRSA